MTKLCPRGKAAAKRKFKVYPSAYANAYASKICAGKIKDPSGVKRKDFRGPKKAEGGRIYKAGGGLMEATQRLGASERMVHSQSVAVQNRRRTQRENIQSVSHLQKRDQCQKAKEDLPLQGNGQLPMWDQNRLT